MKKKLKVLIAKILTLPIFGFIIKLVNGNFIAKDKLKFTIDVEGISYKAISSLYFGFYESAEIRFVKKYLRGDLPLIELGTSLGVISTYCNVINKKKLVCVEANPTLIPSINKNFQLNNIENYTIINAAIGYNNTMFFEPGKSNVSGKLSATFNEQSIVVDMISLYSILNKYGIDEYILICDIEGAEAQLLKNDFESLKNCRQIIIETHEGELDGLKFSPLSLKKMIINLGFVLVDEYGSNFVFKK